MVLIVKDKKETTSTDIDYSNGASISTTSKPELCMGRPSRAVDV